MWGVQEKRTSARDEAGKTVNLDLAHEYWFHAWKVKTEQKGLPEQTGDLLWTMVGLVPQSFHMPRAFALFLARQGRFDGARALFERRVTIEDGRGHLCRRQRWSGRPVSRLKGAASFRKGSCPRRSKSRCCATWARMELALGHIEKCKDWVVQHGMCGCYGLVDRSRRGEQERLAIVENLFRRGAARYRWGRQ